MFSSRRRKLHDDLAAAALGAASEPWLITASDGTAAAAGDAYAGVAGVAEPADAPPIYELYLDDAWRAGIARLGKAAVRSGRAADDIAAPAVNGDPARSYRVESRTIETIEGHLLWRVLDVTLEHEQAAALREEVTRLADLLDAVPGGIYTLDGQGRFRFVNERFAAMVGRSASELVESGLGPGDLLAEGGRSDEARALVQGVVEEAELRFQGPDGRPWWARVSQSPAPCGAPGVCAVVRPVLEATVSAPAGEAALHRLRGLFERAPTGIALLDFDGRVREANAAFTRMVGIEDDIGDRSLVELVPGEDRDEVERRIADLAHGTDNATPIEVRLTDGADRNLLLYLADLDADRDEETGLAAHLIDTTEQKKLELQFAQAQKMQAVGQLAGGIAHDFNNILTAILGFCDLLLMRHQAGDQSFSDNMQVKQNANRATNLVRQLLAFSRQQTLTPRVLAITDVLAELTSLLRRLIGESIELRLIHERDLWQVKVDQGPFEQVVINLAVNARDAMAGAGALTIRTENVRGGEWKGTGHELLPDADFVLIEVKDAGCGISPEDAAKIFEPFFTTKDVGAGTGLGLSTVYGIVKQFKGYIFVDSQVGEGTTFYVFLRRYRAADAAEAEADAADAAATTAAPDADPAGGEGSIPRDLTGKGIVLLVEDEEAVRLFGARALRNKGYTVLEADSGDSALELLSSCEERIDMLVTDVVMPRMDGPTLMGHVRRSNPDIRVVFISGYAEDVFRDELENDETINFLAKPFSIRELAAKVKEVMAAESP